MKEYQAVRLAIFTAQAVEDVMAGKTAVNVTKFGAAMFKRQMAWVREPWNATELPPNPVGDPVAISKALQAKYHAVPGGAFPHGQLAPPHRVETRSRVAMQSLSQTSAERTAASTHSTAASHNKLN